MIFLSTLLYEGKTCTKLDESSTEGQFQVPGFTTPFRRDENKFGGENIDGTFVDLNFHKPS